MSIGNDLTNIARLSPIMAQQNFELQTIEDRRDEREKEAEGIMLTLDVQMREFNQKLQTLENNVVDVYLASEEGKNASDYRVMKIREYFAQQTRSPPNAFVVGDYNYIIERNIDGEAVGTMKVITLNDRTLRELTQNSEFLEIIARPGDGVTTQHATLFIPGVGKVLVGAISPNAEGFSKRYILFEVEGTPQQIEALQNAVVQNRFTIGGTERTLIQEVNRDDFKAERQKAILIADSIGGNIDDGRILFGIAGFAEKSIENEDEILAGLSAYLNVQTSDRTRVFIEGNYVKGAGDGTHVVPQLDLLTGEEFEDQVFKFRMNESVSRQSVGLQYSTDVFDSVLDDTTITFAFDHERSYDDLFGVEEDQGGRIGIKTRVNAFENHPIDISAEQGIGLDRTNVNIRVKYNDALTLAGFFNDGNGATTYGAKAIYSGEFQGKDFQFAGGIQRNPYTGKADYTIEGGINLGYDVTASGGVRGGLPALKVAKAFEFNKIAQDVTYDGFEYVYDALNEYFNFSGRQEIEHADVVHDASSVNDGKPYELRIDQTLEGDPVQFGLMAGQKGLLAQLASEGGRAQYYDGHIPYIISKEINSVGVPVEDREKYELTRNNIFYNGLEYELVIDGVHISLGTGKAGIILPTDFDDPRFAAKLKEIPRSDLPILIEGNLDQMLREMIYLGGTYVLGQLKAHPDMVDFDFTPYEAFRQRSRILPNSRTRHGSCC